MANHTGWAKSRYTDSAHIIQGGPKVGIQFSNTPSKSTFFVLYLNSLPSFTIPVKKKNNYSIPNFGPSCMIDHSAVLERRNNNSANRSIKFTSRHGATAEKTWNFSNDLLRHNLLLYDVSPRCGVTQRREITQNSKRLKCEWLRYHVGNTRVCSLPLTLIHVEQHHVQYL
jgi:hypothetical protein